MTTYLWLTSAVTLSCRIYESCFYYVIYGVRLVLIAATVLAKPIAYVQAQVLRY